MCADNTTYSFFNCGSFPGNVATRFADSRDCFCSFTLAFIETFSGKCGWFAIFCQIGKFLERMSRALIQFVSVSRVERERQLFPLGFVKLRASQFHAGV